jgi:hypothetical protein
LVAYCWRSARSQSDYESTDVRKRCLYDSGPSTLPLRDSSSDDAIVEAYLTPPLLDALTQEGRIVNELKERGLEFANLCQRYPNLLAIQADDLLERINPFNGI